MRRARLIRGGRRRPQVRAGAVLVLALLCAAAGARAAGPAQYSYHGPAAWARATERLFAGARRTPGDSAALVRPLGELVRRLQEQGYLGASARAAWSEEGEPRLHVTVSEGARHTLRSITIAAPSSADSAALAAVLPIRTGDAASPRAVGEAMDRALETASDQGHPYASLGVSGWDLDSGGVHLRISGVRGPLVTISEVRFDGLRTTRAALAERAAGRLAGQPYQRSAALAGRERLLQLGLFRSVSFEGLEGDLDPARAQLVYRVEEPRYNRFEGAVGFQGAAGTVGLANLELGNLAGTGRALHLRWSSRGKGLAEFGARYAEPLLFGTPLRVEGAVQQEVQDTLYTRTHWGGRLRFAVTPVDRIEAGYVHERVVESRGEREESNLQNTVFALERATLDPPLAPRRGIRTRLAGSQVFKTERLRAGGRRTARAGTAEIRFEGHRPLGSGLGLGLDFRASGRFSSERVLPSFERLALGGATSLRGYDEEAFRVDRYALSRLEWSRFLDTGAGRVFLFWDHAWLATRDLVPGGGDRLSDLHRDGIGFGLRLEAAGGVVGVDYGLEPGRPPLEGRVHLQLVSTF